MEVEVKAKQTVSFCWQSTENAHANQIHIEG